MRYGRKTVPMSELAARNGNPESERLFGKDDYLNLLHSRFCGKRYDKGKRPLDAFLKAAAPVRRNDLLTGAAVCQAEKDRRGRFMNPKAL